jgi:hypothetical protein
MILGNAYERKPSCVSFDSSVEILQLSYRYHLMTRLEPFKCSNGTMVHKMVGPIVAVNV